MNYNVVVLSGRLATPPEVREFETGSQLIKLLVTVRSDTPHRRVDVVPVTWWDPPIGHALRTAPVGSAVWVTGRIQRRFFADDTGRRSQLEVVAMDVHVLDTEPGRIEPAERKEQEDE